MNYVVPILNPTQKKRHKNGRKVHFVARSHAKKDRVRGRHKKAALIAGTTDFSG